MFAGTRTLNVSAAFFAFTMMLVVPQVRASGPTCDDDGGPYVCVKWGQTFAPVEGTDFEFDFSDPDKPGVTLIRDDPGWEVWSQEGEFDTDPAALGDLLLNPENNDDDFGVTLKNGANAGARNIVVGCDQWPSRPGTSQRNTMWVRWSAPPTRQRRRR